MTDYTNSFEGGTQAANITVPNSGGTSGTPFSSTSTFTDFDNAHPAHGALSCLITGTGTSAGSLHWLLDGFETIATRCYLYANALPTADTWVGRSLNGGVSNFVVELSAAGKLVLLNRVAGAVWTSASNFPINQQVRVEVFADVGTTTANGQIKIAYYPGDSATATEASALLTGQNLLGLNPDEYTFGKINGNDLGAVSLWFDDLAVRTGASNFIGPFGVAAPTVTVTPNLATIHASGGVAPYTITQLSGTATTPTGSSPNWTVAEHSIDTLVYRITDSNSQTATASIPPAGSAGNSVPLRPVWTGVPGTNWA